MLQFTAASYHLTLSLSHTWFGHQIQGQNVKGRRGILWRPPAQLVITNFTITYNNSCSNKTQNGSTFWYWLIQVSYKLPWNEFSNSSKVVKYCHQRVKLTSNFKTTKGHDKMWSVAACYWSVLITWLICISPAVCIQHAATVPLTQTLTVTLQWSLICRQALYIHKLSPFRSILQFLPTPHFVVCQQQNGNNKWSFLLALCNPGSILILILVSWYTSYTNM